MRKSNSPNCRLHGLFDMAEPAVVGQVQARGDVADLHRLAPGAGPLGDAQHGLVLRQGVDQQVAHLAVARVQAAKLKQPAAEAATAVAIQHRDAELGGVLPIGAARPRIGEVRHGDDLQAPVEHAEQFVALEVQCLGVAGDLAVADGVTETQVAIAGCQCQQVLADALAVPSTQRTDRHPVAQPLQRRGTFRGTHGAWGLLAFGNPVNSGILAGFSAFQLGFGRRAAP
jgi:hypothetical protein